MTDRIPAGRVVSDRILLHGIRFHGHHGVTEDERTVGQWYSVDLELHLDLSAAGRTDDLERTVDYASVSGDVSALGTDRSFSLIEALAETIAEMTLRAYPVERVLVRVTKRPPPDVVASLAPRGTLDAAAVQIERSR